jgi:hypothetical protein
MKTAFTRQVIFPLLPGAAREGEETITVGGGEINPRPHPEGEGRRDDFQKSFFFALFPGG